MPRSRASSESAPALVARPRDVRMRSQACVFRPSWASNATSARRASYQAVPPGGLASSARRQYPSAASRSPAPAAARAAPRSASADVGFPFSASS